MSKRRQVSKIQLRRGAAAVEAAVCLPILVLIIIGAIEVSGGIFQEYNAQACAYELSKVALRSQSTCEDVQAHAETILPQLEFATYSIRIEVVPRSENLDSVDAPTITSFDIPQSGAAPVGLDEVPRGTLLRLTVSADRPAVAGRGLARAYLNSEVSADCVFVKEF